MGTNTRIVSRPRRSYQAPHDPGTRSTRKPGADRDETDGVETREHAGAYVRAWRERLSPEAAGLPAGGSRRTTGLRREELASLASISVDYLVRLEQGRAQRPSTQVLAALARALRLDVEERDHLYRVAGQAPPKRTQISSHVTPGIQRLVDRLHDVPVGVFDAAWNLIAWNAPWGALMGDPSAWTGRDRNILWRVFTGTTGRVRSTDAEARAFEANAVADLRRVAGAYPDDVELRQLIADLCRTSPRFADLWRQRIVNTQAANRKTIVHPDVGALTLDCDVLTAEGTDIRLVVYTADPSTPDADKLDLVRVLGLQRVGSG
jgi:transcriptional regulator with XRE-family HTH domain